MPLDRVAWAALSAEGAWAHADSSMAVGSKQEINYPLCSQRKPQRMSEGNNGMGRGNNEQECDLGDCNGNPPEVARK